jgi:hypothetical protein
MKVLFLASFIVLIASQVLPNQTKGSPKTFTLEFDHAARNGISFGSNSFAVEFNGIRLKEWKPTDYNFYHETFTVNAYPGKNVIKF